MDLFARLTFSYFSAGFSLNFNASEGMPLEDYCEGARPVGSFGRALFRRYSLYWAKR
jgi:hypothetical protein